jgi:TolA-binding protein
MWTATLRSLGLIGLAFCWCLSIAGQSPEKAPKGGADSELVERVIAARREYMQSLISLHDHYAKIGDAERAKWAAEELKAYHVVWKPSYRLDILDVPSPKLVPVKNYKEANDLFKLAKDYKQKQGSGNDYILNQRRAELLFQDILQKYSDSDKIADVAYELGELYEGRAYHQPDRAAAYFERSAQWKKGVRTDAQLRAARIYDKQLNERGKAIEMYREVIQNDTNAAHIKEAERRLAELTSTKK